MKMGASCVGAPHQLLFLLFHSHYAFPFFLSRAFSEGDTHSFSPNNRPPTPAGSSAFLFCALGLASCCVLLCRVRDLCHTECKYMSKHAKHFTDHDMNRHTYAQGLYLCYIYTHLYSAFICLRVCKWKVWRLSVDTICAMCALLMQSPRHSRSSNKPHMNGIHFDRLRRILMNRGQMAVYALCAIIKCFRLMRMFRMFSLLNCHINYLIIFNI